MLSILLRILLIGPCVFRESSTAPTPLSLDNGCLQTCRRQSSCAPITKRISKVVNLYPVQFFARPKSADYASIRSTSSQTHTSLVGPACQVLDVKTSTLSLPPGRILRINWTNLFRRFTIYGLLDVFLPCASAPCRACVCSVFSAVCVHVPKT